jgi:hypothetical protein
MCVALDRNLQPRFPHAVPDLAERVWRPRRADGPCRSIGHAPSESLHGKELVSHVVSRNKHTRSITEARESISQEDTVHDRKPVEQRMWFVREARTRDNAQTTLARMNRLRNE